MTQVEILAPAGSRESLEAAVRSGADAVYLGVDNFNARRNARNFTKEDLPEIVEYCHIRGVKVHVTLNTLVSDAELPCALEVVECGCASGVDAFIIQDLGLARLVHKMAPDVPLHASTQMAVMNAAGFQKLEELGFTRAVLPRELSYREILDIRKKTNLELELFIHGALCMCVSGQCYLSAMLGGRSGNRGLCAQPCRLRFEAPGGTGHDLSLKDLSLISHLPELAEAGICSFKIEGRMKRPEYVAAAVTACQNALQGVKDAQLEENLRAVFSRSGFTDGYFNGQLGSHMFGTRQKEDVVAAAPALASLEHLYEKDNRTAFVDFAFHAAVGTPMTLTADCFTEYGSLHAEVESKEPVAAAQNKAATVESVEKQLRKTGGTGYEVADLSTKLGEDCFLPVSALNELRRSAIDALNEQLSKAAVHPCAPVKRSLPEHKTGLVSTYARVSRFRQIPKSWLAQADTMADAGIHLLFVPLQTKSTDLFLLKEAGIPFGVELPRALYGDLSSLKEKLLEAKGYGAKIALVGNLDGIALAKPHLPVLSNFSINAYNSQTLTELERLGVIGVVASAELQVSDIAKLKGTLPRGIFSYGRLPLMLTRNCPIRNGCSCGSCNKDRCLTDRKNISFPVMCNGTASEVLNSRPIYLGDRLTELRNIDFQLLYFTTESPEEVEAVTKQYLLQAPPEGDFTRGLYYRGVS